jgi:hypothetical protein
MCSPLAYGGQQALARRSWLLVGLLAAFLFAASAPSPLYAMYQARWQFSPVTVT